MKKYELLFTRQAAAEVRSLSPRLAKKLKSILLEAILMGKPLLGALKGNYSYQLSFKDRIIYSIDSDKGVVYIKKVKMP